MAAKPELKPLAELDRETLWAACQKLGVMKVYRTADLGEKALRRALAGKNLVPLTRIKLTAFAEKWREECERAEP